MLSACNTYAPPITAAIERDSVDRSSAPFDGTRYLVKVWIDRRYRQRLATDRITTYVALTDCRTRGLIADRVRAEAPRSDSEPFIATFDLHPSSLDRRHICVALTGGTWRARLQAGPTPLTSMMVLE